jgi:hypothetical protein
VLECGKTYSVRAQKQHTPKEENKIASSNGKS